MDKHGRTGLFWETARNIWLGQPLEGTHEEGASVLQQTTRSPLKEEDQNLQNYEECEEEAGRGLLSRKEPMRGFLSPI